MSIHVMSIQFMSIHGIGFKECKCCGQTSKRCASCFFLILMYGKQVNSRHGLEEFKCDAVRPTELCVLFPNSFMTLVSKNLDVVVRPANAVCLVFLLSIPGFNYIHNNCGRCTKTKHDDFTNR